MGENVNNWYFCVYRNLYSIPYYLYVCRILERVNFLAYFVYCCMATVNPVTSHISLSNTQIVSYSK